MRTHRKHLKPILAGLSLAWALVVRAQAPLPVPAPPMPAPPSPEAPLPPAMAPSPSQPAAPAESQPGVLQERVIPEGLTPMIRDPFWPIGHAPKSPDQLAAEQAGGAPVASPKSVPRWKEARESLHIGGCAKGVNGYTALINNRLVNRGDVVTQPFDGKVYRWKIDSITDHDIAFIPLDWMPAEGNNPQPGKDRP